MDKLYFSSRRTTEALAKLVVDKPNDGEFFRKQYRRFKSLRHWWNRKPIFLINDTEEEEQDSDADEEGATVGLGDRFLTFWEKRRHKLETDFALYG
jgi:hypothetical protein